MPYIDPASREKREVILRSAAVTKGELTYQLTMVVKAYLNAHGLSYSTCNDIAGALVSALDEFQRRVQHPLEDKKRLENGDVY